MTCVFSIHRSFADPFLLEFKSLIAGIEDPHVKHQCGLSYNAVADAASLPLRLAALKLGIAQEEFR